MASNPPGKCCTEGVKHSGTALGEFIKIEDFGTYITGDKSATKVIIIYPDVFGPQYLNVQLVADSFAASGYFVVVPDLFKGDPLVPGGAPLTPEWIGRHSIASAVPIADAAYKWVTSTKREFIGAIGYCYGAPFVIKQLAKGSLGAGAIAHPSFVEIDDVKKLTSEHGPLLISAAETDPIFTPELRSKTEEVLRENGAAYHSTLASGVKHGFAVRGDPEQRADRIAKEKAFADQLWWFKINQ